MKRRNPPLNPLLLAMPGAMITITLTTTATSTTKLCGRGKSSAYQQPIINKIRLQTNQLTEVQWLLQPWFIKCRFYWSLWTRVNSRGRLKPAVGTCDWNLRRNLSLSYYSHYFTYQKCTYTYTRINPIKTNLIKAVKLKPHGAINIKKLKAPNIGI